MNRLTRPHNATNVELFKKPTGEVYVFFNSGDICLESTEVHEGYNGYSIINNIIALAGSPWTDAPDYLKVALTPEEYDAIMREGGYPCQTTQTP